MKKIFCIGMIAIVVSMEAAVFGAQGAPVVPDMKLMGFQIVKVNRILRERYLQPRKSNFFNSFAGQSLHEDNSLLPEHLRGEYFYIVWRYTGSESIKGPVTLRFEAKRVHEEQPAVFMKTYDTINPGKHKEIVTNFGDKYYKSGKMTWWKLSLLSGTQVLDQKISALAAALEK